MVSSLIQSGGGREDASNQSIQKSFQKNLGCVQRQQQQHRQKIKTTTTTTTRTTATNPFLDSGALPWSEESRSSCSLPPVRWTCWWLFRKRKRRRRRIRRSIKGTFFHHVDEFWLPPPPPCWWPYSKCGSLHDWNFFFFCLSDWRDSFSVLLPLPKFDFSSQHEQ